METPDHSSEIRSSEQRRLGELAMSALDSLAEFRDEFPDIYLLDAVLAFEVATEDDDKVVTTVAFVATSDRTTVRSAILDHAYRAALGDGNGGT